MSSIRRAMVALVVLLLVSGGALAQEHTEATDGESHGEAHEAHAEGHPANGLFGILGATYESEEENTYFTWGLEYERVFNPHLGVALGVENITDIDAWVGNLCLVYRHPSGLRLLAGPGIEFKTRRPEFELPEHGEGEQPGHIEGELPGDIADRLPSERENLFLWRFGIAYNVPLAERWVAVPAFDLDFVREDGHWVWAAVFAVSIGFDF